MALGIISHAQNQGRNISLFVFFLAPLTVPLIIGALIGKQFK